MNGPYDYVTPNYWYLDKKNGGAFGFNTETGPGPQPPPLESIKKMIPEGHLWPIDDVWNYHCARGKFNTMDRYLEALDRRYGKPETLEEFSLKAQTANYEAIRGMFEAFGVNKFNATGIIQWMLNAAWPKMHWQLYDYYLMPSGAFYGTRKACQPVNIVYNYADKDIYVVNDTLSEVKYVKAEIRVFDIHSRLIFSKDVEVSVGENRSEKILDVPDWKEKSSVYFLDLKIRDVRGKVLSTNFYWLSAKEDVLDEKKTTWFVTPNKDYADFTALEKLTEVKIREKHEFFDLGSEKEVVVTLENPTESIAFFIELGLYGEKSGSSVLPVFWEDNYVSLLPGELREIRACFSKEDLKGGQPALRLRGWNVSSRRPKVS
jgi:exo-1,4-beta-D-glucosaminidase